MANRSPQTKQCSVCDSVFACGADMNECWCQGLPALDLARIDPRADCRCPGCLAALVADIDQPIMV